jgi:hypothetical protein
MVRTLLGLCVVLAACGPDHRGTETCTAGQMHCNGLVLQTCVGGEFSDSTTCPNACTDDLGCVACQPGTGTCSGNMSHACTDDGTGFVDTFCDPVQGMSCDTTSGQCAGDCSPKALGNSYIGCEYYPTVIGNTVGTTFDYAVAIANTSSATATVTIEGGALPSPQMVEVPGMAVVVQNLPWQTQLKLCDQPGTDGCFGNVQSAALAAKGAYHVRSTSPVTLYQFSPLQYEKGGSFSYTNDASLLLPVNVWREKYFAATWEAQTQFGYPALLAVTAAKDATMVTINAKATTLPGQGAPGFAAGTPQTVMLNAGDVIEITAQSGDLTGSQIDSDKPIEVLSGHYCTNVPTSIPYCDHLEESMFAVDTLGSKYIITAPAMVSIPDGKVQIVRVIATADNTSLAYDPPVAGAPTNIAKAGDFIEIPSNAQTYMLNADQKVLVAQYMEGQDAGGGAGDPAMTVAVPVEQFRNTYMFHAPTNYESNYVDVTAPVGAEVMLDGMPLAFTPIGTTGYALARVRALTNGPQGDGNHSMSATMPFGITVYGYGQYTSYWYPGGLNLDTIIQ